MQPSAPLRRSLGDWRLRALVGGFVLFIAGGIFFGYVFVMTAFELLDLQAAAEASNTPPVGVSPAPTPGQPGGVVVAPTPTPPVGPAERINVLLLGLDERPADNGAPSRSDTMIIASLDTGSQTAALMSIPRDLWVAIPRGNGEVIQHKINTAHLFGQMWRYPDGKNLNGGPELAKRTVEWNLGVPIQYYARIDFKGFEKAIDLVGGIEIDVPRAIVDYAYPLENDAGVTTVRFAAGRQHMDGVTALRYARTRNADSDFGRMARQRQVLMALRDKVLSLDVIPKLPQLIGVMRDSFDTDLPLDKMISLANAARTIKSEDIATAAIDPTMVVWDEPVVGALLPKQKEIERLVGEVFFGR